MLLDGVGHLRPHDRLRDGRGRSPVRRGAAAARLGRQAATVDARFLLAAARGGTARHGQLSARPRRLLRGRHLLLALWPAHHARPPPLRPQGRLGRQGVVERLPDVRTRPLDAPLSAGRRAAPHDGRAAARARGRANVELGRRRGGRLQGGRLVAQPALRAEPLRARRARLGPLAVRGPPLVPRQRHAVLPRRAPLRVPPRHPPGRRLGAARHRFDRLHRRQRGHRRRQRLRRFASL
mmetsp:Transcript_27019/g.78843  ORF Transcript_27019/g.78843 Transcript_27019/m.78843 type:complete len:237 (-) Transcript_27019:236-946(-)